MKCTKLLLVGRRIYFPIILFWNKTPSEKRDRKMWTMKQIKMFDADVFIKSTIRANIRSCAHYYIVFFFC